ncbi:hypothetical protein ACFSKL_19855 [Belliella marina]|uniref:Lipocalin-like domain-containing protein n=1 Tax=Belliella marina TaxID=1644146 RepID=A0ABW4VS64_9BACT
MNRIYSIFVLSFLLFSCAVDSENLNRPFSKSEEIIGSWQFYEYTFSTGSSQSSRGRVENEGVVVSFLEDGSLESLGYFDCEHASYRIEDNILIVDFGCDSEEEGKEYLLSWEGVNLVLSELTTTCIEGCTHVFRKYELD